MTTPDCMSHNQYSAVEQIGLKSFASSTTFNWTLANWLYFFKHLDNFLQRKHFHSQQEAENAFQEFVKIPKHKKKKKRSQSMDFTLQDGTNLFLIGKNVLIEMVPILN